MLNDLSPNYAAGSPAFAQARFAFWIQVGILTRPPGQQSGSKALTRVTLATRRPASLGYVDSPLRPKTVNGVEKSMDCHRR
jgi:hypothetical protein